MKASYWDCTEKRLIHKSITSNKIPNDEKKRILDEWKREMIKTKGTGVIPEKLKEKDETINNVNIESQEEPEIINPELKIDIEYTPFSLKLSPLSETGSSTIIFGASMSGKTTLLKKILKEYYNDNEVIVFMIAEHIHSNIYQDLDKKIIKSDKFDKQLIKTLHRINKRTNNKYHFVIVLDDMILEKHNSTLLKLILTYRNAKISTLILLQSPTLLSRNGRFNGNNFIFKRTNNAENADQVMEFFLSGFEPFYKLKKEEKNKLYKQITDNFGFIYLDALNDKISFHK